MKKRTSPNGKKQTRVFNIRLELDTLSKLRWMAEQEHRTVTNLVQVLVAEAMKLRREATE